ncbi:dystonin-like isoform X1 [Biomphalaria glabrata]
MEETTTTTKRCVKDVKFTRTTTSIDKYTRILSTESSEGEQQTSSARSSLTATSPSLIIEEREDVRSVGQNSEQFLSVASFEFNDLMVARNGFSPSERNADLDNDVFLEWHALWYDMYICDMPHDMYISNMPHDMYICDMPHDMYISNMPHGMHICDMPHDMYISNMPHDIYISNMPHDMYISNMPHDMYICDMPHDMYNSNMPHDMYICDMPHDMYISNMPHDM